MQWADVDLAAGVITIDADQSKTGHGRRIPLDITPMLRQLLSALKLQSHSSEFVFGHQAPLGRDVAEHARKRLMARYGAPRFTWQELRRTCGTYLTCAPGIYGGASAFLAAKRLGHSVQVAERHYYGAEGNIPATARTLGEAMDVTEQLQRIITSLSTGHSRPLPARAGT